MCMCSVCVYVCVWGVCVWYVDICGVYVGGCVWGVCMCVGCGCVFRLRVPTKRRKVKDTHPYGRKRISKEEPGDRDSAVNYHGLWTRAAVKRRCFTLFVFCQDVTGKGKIYQKGTLAPG